MTTNDLKMDTTTLDTIVKMVQYLDSTDKKRAENFKTLKALYGLKGNRKQQDEWGVINHTTSLGKGVRFVSCSGHGGALTPFAVNLTIDQEIRTFDGHYEEDCNIMILLAYYPEMGKKLNPNFTMFATADSTRHYAVARLMDYHRKDLQKILDRVYG